jgi:hypothetical protein
MFLPGETSKVVAVPISNDTLDEDDESFSISLTSATNATLNTSVGTATIVDNDDPPQVNVSDGYASEEYPVDFTISLSTASGKPVTVYFGTSDSSATAGDDYTGGTSSVVISPGQLSTTTSVYVNDDSLDESDESFNFSLTSATHATINDGEGVGTIVDNDDPPDVSIYALDAGSVTEGYYASFTISLSAISGQDITIYFTTGDSSAGSSDYTSQSGSVVISAGYTSALVYVATNDDSEDEEDESFYLYLTDADDADIADNTAWATILDND